MKKTACLNVAGVLAVCALVLSACHKKEAAKPARPPTPVQVAKAEQATVPVMLNAFGRLRALSDVDIKAQVSGQLMEALFVEGSVVEKGAVLFRIDPATYQASVDQNRAQVASAKAALAQKTATLERNKKLLEQSLVSQDDFEKLSTDVDTAKAQLDQAKASLAQAQINLNYCEITAPVTGQTGKRLVDVGNIISAAGNQTLVNIRTTDPLYLDFTVSESFLPVIQKALAAGSVDVLLAAESEAGQAGLFNGRVQLMDNAVDTKSGTIGLRALVNNPKSKLWPGQFVYAFPVVDTIEKAVLVPLSAVALGQEGTYVFAVEEEKVALKPVVKGPVVGDAVVITKGIQEGEVVVTSGQLALWPGAPVQVKTTPDAATQAEIQKRLADPNTLALAKALSLKGETPGQIAMIVGIPPDQIQALLAGSEEPSTPPSATR